VFCSAAEEEEEIVIAPETQAAYDPDTEFNRKYKHLISSKADLPSPLYRKRLDICPPTLYISEQLFLMFYALTMPEHRDITLVLERFEKQMAPVRRQKLYTLAMARDLNRLSGKQLWDYLGPHFPPVKNLGLLRRACQEERVKLL